MRDAKKNHRPSQTSVELTIGTRIVLVLLGLFLIMPLIWGIYFTDTAEREKFEKRELATFPGMTDFSDIDKFFLDFEKYMDDHIGFAVRVNRFYTELVFHVFGESTVPKISVGRDGFVFLNSHSSKMPNSIFRSLCEVRTSEQQLEKYFEKIVDVNDIVSSFGHRAIFAVPISKPTLYPKKLPLDVGRKTRMGCESFMGRDNILKRIAALAREHDIFFHYPYEIFMEAMATPNFYPKENFHWSGKSPHLFSKTMFQKMGVEVDDRYDEGATLKRSTADLRSMGFTRRIRVWKYPYKAFGLLSLPKSSLSSLKKMYENARDFSHYTSAVPLQNRDAILISNSFGFYAARHLAPGYRSLKHININGIKQEEGEGFFRHIFALGKNMDIIFLFHDGDMVTGASLSKLGRALRSLSIEKDMTSI